MFVSGDGVTQARGVGWFVCGWGWGCFLWRGTDELPDPTAVSSISLGLGMSWREVPCDKTRVEVVLSCAGGTWAVGFDTF